MFLTAPNFETIFSSQAALAVITLGLIVPLTAGDYDLSIASVTGMSAMIIAVLNVLHGWPVGLTVLVALAAGLMVGVVDGLITVIFGIESLIVTLVYFLVTGITDLQLLGAQTYVQNLFYRGALVGAVGSSPKRHSSAGEAG